MWVSIRRYGCLVRLDRQISAPHARCVRCSPTVIPMQSAILYMQKQEDIEAVSVARLFANEGVSTLTYISQGHSLCAISVGFGIFPGVFELFIRCAKISSPWGGHVCAF